MAAIPRDRILDSTRALRQEGYRFVMNRCRRLHSDVFQTRLLGRSTLCFRGEDAARAFFDSARVSVSSLDSRLAKMSLLGDTRDREAAPETEVQSQSSVFSPRPAESAQKLLVITEEQWRRIIPAWQRVNRIVLFNEARDLLCTAACLWNGIPLEEGEASGLARDLWTLVDSDGALTSGRRIQGMLAERRVERWLTSVLRQVGSGRLEAEGATVLRSNSHRPIGPGREMEARRKARALIPILRSVTAIASSVTFAALALHHYPRCRRTLLRSIDSPEAVDYLERFVFEVRRFYPHTPFLAGRVRVSFEWRGFTFPKGRDVLLDVYGTLHDERLWEKPDEFRPERFLQRPPGRFDLTPDGVTRSASVYPFPGERIAIDLTKLAVTALTNAMTYDVPQAQDFSIDLSRIPTAPVSGFVIANVRAAGASGGRQSAA